MKAHLKVAGLIVALALFGYFVWFCWHNLDLSTLASALENPRTLLALAAAIFCYMAIYPVTGLAWRQLLLAQGIEQPTHRLTLLLGIAQLAKYVPGNVMQHAYRATLALKHGVPLRPYTLSVLHETILAAAASILVGATLFLPEIRQGRLTGYGWLLTIACAGSCAAIAIFCFKPNFLDSNAAPSTRLQRLLRTTGRLPGPTVTLMTLTAYCFNYLSIGLGLWLLARTLGLSDAIDYRQATSAFALSWILGFLAPGTPAGMGAREGIMVMLLGSDGDSGQLALFVLLSRATTIAGDLATFLFSSIIYSLESSKNP
ncbi:lysylphosphatidylglycerol synthase transmembrane domain-containing protein [Stenotrophomonas sp. MH1]|uniref:Lysylphosphatidylglycerol synthase transmembrane domain-containing protein n=1 Tax=Stenotrophomonas capsici TaxID=3110230 RepID=A0ABU5V5P7_9GAMM|nr:lysylphosphatidylglycerol synthase transmembrane domain-containing protein [Stenotrophomonas sp. MH1]MEA5668656.1 lysylphosphatidylglycerol synthase transmembrane domain-containing protein [Stenotrophomonas sp. MH1]